MSKEHLPYYKPELSREVVSNETDYTELDRILTSTRIIEEAEAGNITLAMIRPHVGPEANLLGLEDSQCADKIETMISGLGVAVKFSFMFTEETVERFYEGAPQSTMEQAEPKDPEEYDSRWPEFVDFMTSGPTTALLLHDISGQAIEKWRDHLGHWNISANRDAATIRGALAVDIFNNLVHGSDAPESVIREIDLIHNQLASE